MARRHDQPLNLDSFLDLLSNTVGALILILILSMVTGGSICIQPFQPVQNQQLHYFVSRGNRVTRLPIEQLGQSGLDGDWIVNEQDNCFVLLPRQAGLGESVQDLLVPQSQLRSIISALDPGTDAIFVVVFADSFEVFRAVRQIAREYQIQVGWQPIEGEVTLCRGDGKTRPLVEPKQGHYR